MTASAYTQEVFDLLNLYFPPEWLKAALVLSIISTWVLVGLFAYLNQYTQRRYFSLWTIAWLFYALWLTASINQLDAPESQIGVMLTQSCIGVCALFLFWGNVSILRHSVAQWNILGGIAIVLLWSYIGIYQLSNKFWLQLPLFVMLGAASLFTAVLFFVRRRQRRYIGASILALGFLLWSLYLIAYPFIYLKAEFAPSGFLLSATLQLIIAFGMIVLVLEEVRYESRTVRARLRQDVKRTRVLEKEVVASEDKYRNLFNDASDGILIVDAAALTVLETNEAGSRLFAMDARDLTTRTFLQLCPALAPRREELAGHPEQFCEALECAETLQLPRPDGTSAIAEGRAVPVRYAGRDAIQISLRDLSERTRLEQRMRQTEKLSALGQLISGVAHELNNPLAIVMGRAQLMMARDNVDPKIKTDLALMNHESERASKIVQRLLAFARPQPPEKNHLQLNELIEQVAELLEVDTRNQRIQLVLELDRALPKTMADAHQIEQVLMNLAQNAKQAMLEDKKARARVLRIRTEIKHGAIRISVIDNGPGIPPQNLGKIFDPFFTTKPTGVGTGLGLSICFSILKEHGGNLFVQSEVGRGAAFTMELPIVAPEIKPATAPAAASASEPVPVPDQKSHAPSASQSALVKGNGHDPHAKKPRILLVDDEPAIAGVLSELLSGNDYDVQSATNGQEALDLLNSGAFDLIISDLKMPGMDGRELYKKVQQQHPRLLRRIIFLTGDTVSKDTRQFLDDLKTPWLCKPFNISEVESTVRSSLQAA